MSMTRRTTCRLCGSINVGVVVPLPATTLADHYRRSGEPELPRYPIDVYQCASCWHVQLLDVVDPRILFHDEFTYMPSNNPALERHFEGYARRVVDVWSGDRTPVAVDVGSNDGLYLRVLRDHHGATVLGVDPARGPVEYARSQGIETLHAFLDDDAVTSVLDRVGPADLVSANNVYAHMDDLSGFTSRVAKILAARGVFSFEFSYLVDVVEKGLLGTFFHEHLSTHSVTSLEPFLEQHELRLIDLQRVDTQGGAAIGIAARLGDGRTPDPSVSEARAMEVRLGLADSSGMRAFRTRVESDRDRVAEILASCGGKRIVGFGAARSANLLVDYFELAPHLEYVVDDNAQKVGKVWNSHDIPIVPSSALTETRPDVVVCLAWIHTERITARLKELLGGRTKILQLYPEVCLV